MQHTSTIKFIFKSQTIITNITANDIRLFPDNILFSFINEPHEYQIQSDISEEVFDSIIQYFDQHKLPDIQINNYFSYIQLNKELCIPAISNLLDSLKDKWETCLLNIESLNSQSVMNKSDIEEEIAKNLDKYIVQYGQQLINLPIQSLYAIFNHPNRLITEHNRLYELIMQHYEQTNEMEIFTLLPSIDAREIEEKNVQESIDMYSSHGCFVPSFAFSALSKEIQKLKKCQKKYFKIIQIINRRGKGFWKSFRKLIYDICGTEDFDEALKFKKEQITTENLIVELDDDEKTAEIVKLKNDINDLFIPRFVSYQSQKYSIKNLAFSIIKEENINSIDFPDDSEIEKLEYKLDCYSLIDTTISMNNNRYFSSIQSQKAT